MKSSTVKRGAASTAHGSKTELAHQLRAVCCWNTVRDAWFHSFTLNLSASNRGLKSSTAPRKLELVAEFRWLMRLLKRHCQLAGSMAFGCDALVRCFNANHDLFFIGVQQGKHEIVEIVVR